jgi:hypothetical protein
MNFDNAANAIWLGASLAEGDKLTVGAKAVVRLYHERKNDIWDWKDLHMGPNGKNCSAPGEPPPDVPMGEAMAGEPFVNSHYARQLQGWVVQRALVGQVYNAAERTLLLAPPSEDLQVGALTLPTLLSCTVLTIHCTHHIIHCAHHTLYSPQVGARL